ncbi:hypothetical protein KGQ34_04695 [Patescibacteria group bacterium]|nr:hypothetical protein [Patescibacteria group bacterium]
MFQRIWSITLNAYRESMRDRILLSVFVFALVMIVFSLFVGSISLEQDKAIIEDMGLALIFFLQLFIAVFVGANLMHKEIQQKTFFMIVPKPIRKHEIILGKFFGLGMTNALVTVFSSLVFFAVVFWQAHGFAGVPAMALAIAFGFLETMLILLASMLFSSFTSPILASVYAITLFFVGHSATVFRGVIEKQNSFIARYGLYALYYLFPNFEKFNIRNEIVYGITPDAQQILLALGYGVAYGLFLFVLTSIIFEQREY